jgi:capsular polysaccharide biosynthesis protein
MTSLFSPPSLDDLIHLLKAWKFWVLGAIVGALIGAAFYYIVPPTYRARATVNVDFNLEQAWPQDTDRQQFYYLERETRKLEEIAWSDDVMKALSSDSQIPVQILRAGKLQLSQPAEAGWHFYAEDKNRKRAQDLAGAWAKLFAQKVQENVANSQGLNSYIRVDATQTDNLPVDRSVHLSIYLISGAVLFLALSAIGVLFLTSSPLRLRTAPSTDTQGQSSTQREGSAPK